MAAKPSSPVLNLQELVTCSVCLEDFTDPRALPCVHSYCKACLDRLMTPQGKITCPQCRIEVEVPDSDVSKLSPNFVMNSLLEMVSLTNEVHVPTTHGDSADTLHCPSHEGRECELYCNDCSKLICFRCIVKWGDCHDHSYRDVIETANKFRENIQEFSEKRKRLLPTVEQHLSLLQGMKAEQVANLADVCEMIEESFRSHVDNLNIRKNELVATASMTQWQGEEGLLAELDRVQLERAKLANTVEFCEKIIEIESPAMFVQKYCEVRERFLETNLPELFSHVEVRDVRFEENQALLRDVILNYGGIVNKNAPSEEKPSVPGPHEGKIERKGEGTRVKVAAHGNPGPLRQAESLPNVQRHQATGGRSDEATTSATAREVNGRNTSIKQEPVSWKLYPKNWDAHVSIDDKGLSVKSRSTRCFSVLGMPGFRNGKHSWKVKLECLETVVGIGVCLGKKEPGLCVMLDSALSYSIMVTVELDCDAKVVKVKREGHLGNSIAFENNISSIHPYFFLSPMNMSVKLTIVEMDGKSAIDDAPGCSIL